MSRFDNKLCPICRRPLTEKSDVVVCPVCGTPHHRACYMAAGHCGVEEFHAQGFEWKGYLPGEEPLAEPQKAPQESTEEIHDSTGEFSEEHNADYPEGQPIDLEQFLEQFQRQTTDDTRGADGVSSKELSTFVGRSVMHYSQAFAAFRAPAMPGRGRRKVFINVWTGLFAPMHQFYRKMDLLGIIVMLITLLNYAPLLLNQLGIGTISQLSNLQTATQMAAFGAKILLCIFGDYLYYRFAVKRIHKIRAKYDDGRAEGYYEALAEKGTPSWLRAIIAMLAMTLAVAWTFMQFGIDLTGGTV